MTSVGYVPHDIKSLDLADAGRRKIEWADRQMPVLAAIRARFEQERPLAGLRIASCQHVTTETANLMRTLKAAGADVVLCASNPLSTQDEVAAAMVVHYGIGVFAIRGVDADGYYRHLDAAIDTKPNFCIDDGADVIGLMHSTRDDALADMMAASEETTTGVIRLRALEAQGRLAFPVIAVTTRRPSTSSTTATAPGSRRSTASSARPTCCWPAGSSWSAATAGAAAGSRAARAAWAPG